MITHNLITVIMLIGGAAIMMLSIVRSMKLYKQGLTNQYIKWLLPLSLMIAVLLGCVFLFIALFSYAGISTELIIGTLFLSSTILVYLLVRLMEGNSRSLHQEVSERKKVEGKLKEMSLIDQLTDLYNRNGFIILMENQLKLARRLKRRVLLLYADIDNLKRVNDMFGYQEGDMMLKEAAHILKASFRNSDIVARVGDDEFVIFLVGATDDNADMINDKFQKKVKTYNEKRHQNYKLLLNTCVTHYDPEFNESIESMLTQAAEALHTKKIQPKKQEHSINF